ncbi:hypothetical protein MTR_1g030030 [Medicago truncatula]|uniref:Uncharacterized protein n=1 Tax=Medicago truncatula TaxID=3880 RepID=A0A072VET7_MEDTR|nr:hypothetical protein MTR_1g030030 [Medicago truncatula]
MQKKHRKRDPANMFFLASSKRDPETTTGLQEGWICLKDFEQEDWTAAIGMESL